MKAPDLFTYKAAPKPPRVRPARPRREPRAAPPSQPPRHADEDDELAAMVDRWVEILAA